MSESTVKINCLELENVKRIRAVRLEPSPSGLTIIGGRNNQGKSSVLDAIAWALGGERYRPTQPQREGSAIPPMLHITLSNGLVVERKGKSGSLKVTDPRGVKGGQQILGEFIEQLALDLPRFMQSTGKDKAAVLLKIIGVGDKLRELEREESELYNRRHTIGQIADQKKKYAAEAPCHPEAPREMISVSELIRRQQAILVQNGENQQKRIKLEELKKESERIKAQLAQLNTLHNKVLEDLETARKDTYQLQDESTAELERDIADIEILNAKIRANMDKDKAAEDAKQYEEQYRNLSVDLEDVRKAKTELLQNAKLPLPGLSVENGDLLYNGKQWDCMSGSEQLKVSAAIVRSINPRCGFVLLDKLEQMDNDTLREFGGWLVSEGLQVIATRVGTGDECSIIIEDGVAVTKDEDTKAEQAEQASPLKSWIEGEF